MKKKYKSLTLLDGIKRNQPPIGNNGTIIIDMDDNILMWGSISNKEIPILIPNIKGKQVAIGYDHILILDFDGNVYGLGDNNFGQLGLIPLIKNSKRININTWNKSPIYNNRILRFGNNRIRK